MYFIPLGIIPESIRCVEILGNTPTSRGGPPIGNRLFFGHPPIESVGLPRIFGLFGLASTSSMWLPRYAPNSPSTRGNVGNAEGFRWVSHAHRIWNATSLSLAISRSYANCHGNVIRLKYTKINVDMHRIVNIKSYFWIVLKQTQIWTQSQSTQTANSSKT